MSYVATRTAIERSIEDCVEARGIWDTHEEAKKQVIAWIKECQDDDFVEWESENLARDDEFMIVYVIHEI